VLERLDLPVAGRRLVGQYCRGRNRPVTTARLIEQHELETLHTLDLDRALHDYTLHRPHSGLGGATQVRSSPTSSRATSALCSHLAAGAVRTASLRWSQSSTSRAIAGYPSSAPRSSSGIRRCQPAGEQTELARESRRMPGASPSRTHTPPSQTRPAFPARGPSRSRRRVGPLVHRDDLAHPTLSDDDASSRRRTRARLGTDCDLHLDAARLPHLKNIALTHTRARGPVCVTALGVAPAP
jgi:hypothetical protein